MVGPDSDDFLTLDVRVYLMESQDSENLTAQLEEGEVESLMEGVNEVWSQANIEWQVASVERVDALNGADFERALRGEIPATFDLLSSIIPEGISSQDRWEIFLIRDLGGGIGGVYFPGMGAVIQPEIDPQGGEGLEGGLVRILSHELGHALGLRHVRCEPQGNLMAPGCFQGDRTRIVQRQIDFTREQAATNRPYRSGGPVTTGSGL